MKDTALLGEENEVLVVISAHLLYQGWVERNSDTVHHDLFDCVAYTLLVFAKYCDLPLVATNRCFFNLDFDVERVLNLMDSRALGAKNHAEKGLVDHDLFLD